VTARRLVKSRRTARVRCWLVAPILAAACFLAPLPASSVEAYYSRELFPRLQNVVTAASNLVPIALFDVLIGLAVILILYRLVRLIGVWRRAGAFAAGAEAFKRLVRAAAGVAVLFMLLWGFNYRRLPLEASIGAATTPPSEAALVSAVSDAGRLATKLRPAAVSEMPQSLDDTARLLREPMDDALRRLQREPLARPGRPKVSRLLTPYFTAAGVDGMINPIALESIVHPDLLPFERPYVLAHEWAHLAGHGDEADASAVGWFACMHGGPALAYSASLYLVMQGAGALRGQPRSRALSTLDAGVRADLEAIRQRLLRQQPQVRQASTRVYDQYLKANRVEDGTASYGRALTIILSPTLREALSSYPVSP
jgi:hypothetical protein